MAASRGVYSLGVRLARVLRLCRKTTPLARREFAEGELRASRTQARTGRVSHAAKKSAPQRLISDDPCRLIARQRILAHGNVFFSGKLREVQRKRIVDVAQQYDLGGSAQ